MITVDYRDSRPIYEQIIERVKVLCIKGAMKPGESLPSVRSLAMDLGINPNTIQRAYQELERQGYIYSVKGKGSFISDTADLSGLQKARLIDEFNKNLTDMREAGFSQEEIIDLVKKGTSDT